MKDFLDCGNIPDAVITSSDAMAIGAIEAINEKD